MVYDWKKDVFYAKRRVHGFEAFFKGHVAVDVKRIKKEMHRLQVMRERTPELTRLKRLADEAQKCTALYGTHEALDASAAVYAYHRLKNLPVDYTPRRRIVHIHHTPATGLTVALLEGELQYRTITRSNSSGVVWVQGAGRFDLGWRAKARLRNVVLVVDIEAHNPLRVDPVPVSLRGLIKPGEVISRHAFKRRGRGARHLWGEYQAYINKKAGNHRYTRRIYQYLARHASGRFITQEELRRLTAAASDGYHAEERARSKRLAEVRAKGGGARQRPAWVVSRTKTLGQTMPANAGVGALPELSPEEKHVIMSQVEAAAATDSPDARAAFVSTVINVLGKRIDHGFMVKAVTTLNPLVTPQIAEMYLEKGSEWSNPGVATRNLITGLAVDATVEAIAGSTAPVTFAFDLGQKLDADLDKNVKLYRDWSDWAASRLVEHPNLVARYGKAEKAYDNMVNPGLVIPGQD